MTGSPMSKYYCDAIQVADFRVETKKKDSNLNEYSKFPSCTVIVPTLKLSSDVIGLVQSLKGEISAIQEIIIVVDGIAPDISVIPIEFKNMPIQILATGKNLGASIARNLAIDHAIGDVLLFLDSDCEPKPGIIKKHLHRYEDPKIIAVGGSTSFNGSGSLLDELIKRTSLLYSFSQSRISKEIKWSPTVNFSVRSEKLGEIRFDPEFPKKGGGEDVYFGLLLNNKGTIVFEPSAEVVHPVWRGLFNVCRRFLRWGWADSILTEKVIENPKALATVILRELSVTSWILISSSTAFCIYVATGDTRIVLLPIFSLLGYLLPLVYFGIRGGQSFLEAISDKVFCFIYDIGSTLGRLHPRRRKAFGKRILYFDDQMLPLWQNSHLGERGALFAVLLFIIVVFFL